MRVLKFTCAALLVSASVVAQDEVARKQAVEVMARVPFETAMKGAPYSAEVVIENSQALADGNRISRKTTGAVYRDGEGRTRREEDALLSATTGNGPASMVKKTISIVDPVEGFSYSLDPERKVAFRTPIGGSRAFLGKLEATVTQQKLEMERMMIDDKARAVGGEEKPRTAAPASAVARGGRGGAMAATGGGRVGVVTRDDAMPDPNAPLEHKTIEGVAVEGRKTTTVLPAGQVGNEQPITITSEEWRSPELNLLVLTRHSDPRSGDSSYRLQNIIRAEPDHSLFVVPPDYTIKETGIRRMEPARQ